MYSLTFVAHSEVGRVRKNNQDSGYASPTLLAVADGMGGAAAGDLASAVAVKELSRCDARYEGEDMLEALSGALSRANDTICDLVAADPSLDGMGTTVCGALFSGTHLGLVHVGDSRGYLLRDGRLSRLTHDHSWVQSLIDEGRLTAEQAESHPHRSLLLKVLNGQPSHTPDVELIEANEGDRIMFCSDGLCGLVHDDEIAKLMATHDLDEAVTKLVEAANEAGGQDNITVVLAEIVQQSQALDEAAPVTVGAATEREIPNVEPANSTSSFPSVSSPLSNTDETERYTPHTKRFRWTGTGVIILIALMLVGLGGWGAYAYTRTKFFVGSNNEVVTIFRGVPGDLLGLPLHEVVDEQPTKVVDLPVYYQDLVGRGISVASLDKAEETAAELATKAVRCKEIRKKRLQSTPNPTASVEPSVPVSPAQTTENSVGAPYPYPSTDPEEC